MDVQQKLRSAMRRHASSVCLITTGTAIGPRGMTATAVMSLSLEPPYMAVAVNREAAMNPQLVDGAAFCINVLSEGQAELGQAFSGGLPPHQRFSRDEWDFDASGAPVALQAVAAISCVVERRLELATHSLMIAAVREVRLGTEAQPLLYAHGAYAALRDPAASPA